MNEKYLTLHPDPDKQGVRIDWVKYQLVAQAIQDLIARAPGVKLQRLRLSELQ